MNRKELEALLEIKKVEIARHNEEWAGMLGTCWERDDFSRKIADALDIRGRLIEITAAETPCEEVAIA